MTLVLTELARWYEGKPGLEHHIPSPRLRCSRQSQVDPARELAIRT